MNVELRGGQIQAAMLPVDSDVLTTFVAIAESGSFSKAAQRVFRTPSAVSMQIKKLEETLGTSLFERDSRSVKLTADGELLLTYARRILALGHEMMARFIAPDIAGTVGLGAPEDYGSRLLPVILKRFAETHPNVAVNVVIDTSENLEKRYRNGEIDVTIYTSSDKFRMEPGATVVLEEDLVWAGLKGGCAWERDPLPVSMWEQGCAWRAKAVQSLSKAGRSWRVAYLSSQSVAQRAAVVADLAIAPFPASFMEPPMVCLGEKQGLPPIGTYQIRLLARDGAGSAVRAVTDHVTASFEMFKSGALACMDC